MPMSMSVNLAFRQQQHPDDVKCNHMLTGFIDSADLVGF